MTAKLKACPHCGGPATIHKGAGGDYWVDCERGCEGKLYDTEREAARAWNTRTRSRKPASESAA